MASIQTGIELNDQFTSVIYGIINAVNLAVSSMEDMQQTVNSSVDISSIEGIRNEINQATIAIDQFNAAMAQQVTPSVEHIAPVQEPLEWQTYDGLEVFTNTGMDRFLQEIQSTNHMLNTLNQTQLQIEQTASTMNILPDSAIQDINAIGQRMQTIQERIIQIESNPLNMGTDILNQELEQLRGQLNQAVQQQNELNEAMQNMDISSANMAYLRLSQTIGSTERYIRDNVEEQDRFNQEIHAGISEANTLMNKIGNIVTAYVSLQTVGNVINLSDAMTQTSARLEFLVDVNAGESIQELEDKIYASAQNARGSYMVTADAIAKLGIQAGDAFSTNDELIAFTELLNKQFVNAGTSAQGIESVMLQLTQSMAAGKLQGEELNAVLDNAAPIVQNIQDYLEQVQGIDASNIKELASEGIITAEIIKNAMFYSANEINAKFEEMPMTWGQAWNSIQNTALRVFEPVLQRINDIPSSSGFQEFVDGVIQAMGIVASVTIGIFDTVTAIGTFVSDNWSIISPIIYGVIAALAVYGAYLAIIKGIEIASAVATTAMTGAKLLGAVAMFLFRDATWASATAQMGLNSAMYECPIVGITVSIIALISIIVALCNWIVKTTGIASSAIGIICGLVAMAGAFILNTGIDVLNAIIQALWTIFVNPFITIIEWVLNVALGGFDSFGAAVANLIGNIISWFLSLGSVVTKIIDAIFNTNWTAGLNSLQDSVVAWGKNENAITLERTAPSIDYHFDYGTAFDVGASWGDDIATKFNNSINGIMDNFMVDIPNIEDYPFDYNNAIADGIANGIGSSGIGDSVNDIAGNTGSIADELDVSSEELKYLCDLAEQEVINRFTTAEIKIDMTNHNTISSSMDLDGFISSLTDAVNEAVENMTEGVHA